MTMPHKPAIMKYNPAFLFIFFNSIFLSTGLNAQVSESIEYKYYQISPRSVYEIKPELMHRSPIRAGGGSFNGHTDWFIDWRYQLSQTPYGCQVHGIQTKVHVIHTLPALSDHVSDQQTIDVFTKFSAALTQHEKNHGNNGLTAAREMDKAFNAIPPQQSCRKLAAIIDSIGNSTVQKYIQADDDYDRITGNGSTEGAVIY